MQLGYITGQVRIAKPNTLPTPANTVPVPGLVPMPGLDDPDPL